MFLGYQNERIALVAGTKEELESVPCMMFDRIEETQDEYVLEGGEYVKVDDAYLAAKLEKEKEAKRAEIQSQLDILDLKSIRALRANETGRIQELEAQAEQLRASMP